MPNMPVVLVPVDGSEQSMSTIDYLSRILSPSNVGIELLHVHSESPDSFFDLGETDAFSVYEREIGVWRRTCRNRIDQFMESALKRFLDAGFPSGHLSITVEDCRIGIARDILNKSEQGYAAMAIGRKSNGSLPDFMLGSVAAKLAETVVRLPLAVVGGKPEPRNIVVGIDQSAFIRKGLSALIPLLSRALENIWLCHIVRPLSESHPGRQASFSSHNQVHWLEAGERRILPSMTNAEQRLIRAGFSPKTFHSVIVKGKASRADGLCAEARTLGAGTVVVGRRGTTLVEDFTMGRVTRKILHLACEKAVWIV